MHVTTYNRFVESADSLRIYTHPYYIHTQIQYNTYTLLRIPTYLWDI